MCVFVYYYKYLVCVQITIVRIMDYYDWIAIAMSYWEISLIPYHSPHCSHDHYHSIDLYYFNIGNRCVHV